MGEAQRYPNDYDGIVSGAPVIGFTRSQIKRLSTNKVLRDDIASFIPGSKYRMVHQAVLQQCDALDGVEDLVLTNPMQCDFDPGVLLCTGDDGPECLTESQLGLLRTIYGGPVNARTGEQIMWGRAFGAELEWAGRTNFSEEAPTFPLPTSTFYRYFVYEDPDWQPDSFDFDEDVDDAYEKWGAVMNNFDPDLSRFSEAGGKLIHYHGWNDAHPSPGNSIDYFKKVQETLGDTSDFYRLFMVPGMGHCRGGPGTDRFDRLAEIRAWVEDGRTPDRILAEHRTEEIVDRTRPLCPHPEIAKYNGQGSTDDAVNFTCANP